jgi:hypothetical protein
MDLSYTLVVKSGVARCWQVVYAIIYGQGQKIGRLTRFPLK